MTTQEKLIETDHEVDRPLIESAERLKELRSEYAGLGKQIKDAAEAVKAIMHERGIPLYVNGELRIELKPGAEKVVVTIGDSESAPMEEDGDGE
jgi:thiamine monophosphate synthase